MRSIGVGQSQYTPLRSLREHLPLQGEEITIRYSLLAIRHSLLRLPIVDCRTHEHPVVEPHVSHFKQVPLRTSVKFAHSGQLSPT